MSNMRANSFHSVKITCSHIHIFWKENFVKSTIYWRWVKVDLTKYLFYLRRYFVFPHYAFWNESLKWGLQYRMFSSLIIDGATKFDKAPLILYFICKSMSANSNECIALLTDEIFENRKVFWTSYFHIYFFVNCKLILTVGICEFFCFSNFSWNQLWQISKA